MITVIDVSYANGVIDWDRVKPNIDGVIIRCGYGSDIASQDDKQWARNVAECERLGIPYGAYLYSYANTTDKIRSEIAHTKRLLSGHTPQLPVFYDLEERGCRETWGEAAGLWCKEIRAEGYIDGLYSWAWSINGCMPACASAYWVADYGINDGKQHRKPVLTGGRKLTAWQYTSRGHCNGVNSAGLDVSEWYGDFSVKRPADSGTSQKPSTTAQEPHKDNVPRLDLEVQCLNRGRSGKKIGGGEICMADDSIVGLSIGATLGGIKYRVHKLGGGWFSQITKCDWVSPDAYAGDLHSQIDAVQIYYKTDPTKTGGKYYAARYQVKTQKHGWLPAVEDTNWESGDGNHTAGIFGDPVIGIRVEAVPC